MFPELHCDTDMVDTVSNLSQAREVIFEEAWLNNKDRSTSKKVASRRKEKARRESNRRAQAREGEML